MGGLLDNLSDFSGDPRSSRKAARRRYVKRGSVNTSGCWSFCRERNKNRCAGPGESLGVCTLRGRIRFDRPSAPEGGGKGVERPKKLQDSRGQKERFLMERHLQQDISPVHSLGSSNGVTLRNQTESFRDGLIVAQITKPQEQWSASK